MNANPVKIWPSTLESINAFQLMGRMPNEEKPICEMNDQTARDITVIWASIQALATRWRGARDMRFPGMPIDRKEFWGVFASNPDPVILPVAKEFIESTEGQGKTAIDLGCGNSLAVKLLLGRGWRVTAVDSSKSALNMLVSQNKQQVESGQLKIVESDVTAFTPSEPVDFVIAADIFPYIDPLKFQATWSKIHDNFIKKNGFLVGNLFRHPGKPELENGINNLKELGAWFLPDRRMVRPLLTHAGYHIRTCKYRFNKRNDEPIAIQFIAEKKG